jgi:cobalamin biosynthesis protein CobT
MSLVGVRGERPALAASTMIPGVAWSASAETVAYLRALAEDVTLQCHFRHAYEEGSL